MSNNILICGVGGQGTVLASKIIASTALSMGFPVVASETIGMAQRGGGVVSHVRVGEDVFSPLIPLGHADAIIAFEPSEGARCAKYLKPDGIMIVSDRAIQPVTASLLGTPYDVCGVIKELREKIRGCFILSGKDLCEKIGVEKALNIALIGALCKSGKTFLTVSHVVETLVASMQPKMADINIKALEIGASEMEKSI